MTSATQVSGSNSSARSDTMVAAIAAFAFGAFLVFGVGFAAPNALHNAAHDTRHAIAFPCH